MLFEKSPFSGSVINYRTPCRSSEGRLCDVFADLTLWNEFFWQVGLELREFSPGQLCLAEMCDGEMFPDRLEKEEAATLLCHLLSHHRCIVSVHLNYHVYSGHHQLICDSLRKSQSLRKLKFCQQNMILKCSQSFAAVLPHLNQLQELELSHVYLDCTSLEALSEFLATTRSLTTLTMTDHSNVGREAVVILRGLRQNVTISTLSFHTDLLRATSYRLCETFADFLRRNQTLRSLTVSSRDFHLFFKDLGPIVGVLSCSTTLSELYLISFTIDILDNKAITDMLSRNQGLKRFHMVNCVFYEYDPNLRDWVLVSGSGSKQMPLWLAAFAENNTLEELTMGLSWIKPEDFSSFFRALACNTSLKKVNVQNFMDKDVAHICQAIRDTGVPERFFIDDHVISKDTAAVLLECKALSRISLYRLPDDEVEALHNTLRLLPMCSHLKSLDLQLPGFRFRGKVSSLIAQYLTDTTALRELRLEFFSEIWPFDWSYPMLLQALSNNKSIRRLSLERFSITEEEARVLVEMLQSSRTLCRFSFHPHNCQTSTSVILMLSPIISSNYMLIDMRTNWRQSYFGWYPIKDVMRRNNSLVTRAAHFVMGTRHKHCAAAAELMQFNPGLVEKVQELASVDENEAVSRIEDSLKSFSELDDFMCLAGIVKYGVTCKRRDDGQKQLVDLNRDCWLHIRQFLKVGDILDPK